MTVACILKPCCYLVYTLPFGRYSRAFLLHHRETGASCAMKEVEMFPDDPKSADCIKQLEQVLPQRGF